MRTIGLTGGIACGKSFVAGLLRSMGALIIDADEIYHELLRQGALADEIRRIFGDDYFLPDGILDRKKLGALVFSDKSSLEMLNTITHPAVLAEIQKRLDTAERSSHPLVVVVVPLLFEAGWERYFEIIVVVSANEELQKTRLMKRSRLSEQQARARIASQIPLSEKTARADYVIDNTGSRDETSRMVSALFDKLVS